VQSPLAIADTRRPLRVPIFPGMTRRGDALHPLAPTFCGFAKRTHVGRRKLRRDQAFLLGAVRENLLNSNGGAFRLASLS
jgi:hypothetical protein